MKGPADGDRRDQRDTRDLPFGLTPGQKLVAPIHLLKAALTAVHSSMDNSIK